ncbi:tetratricopeptide repeat protein [Methylomonas paludis]|uniref:Ancillary SecYEG translocon subunit n=1 Tax=Methylomonas paludis TaxID=1173101 RepID=A0A975ML02_9GAMM|nr:tetratricopeptide repeat protein [Methylomonas paludis]QWF69480.1 tetratricopeptide repeat protein [Methylomonas paludis]
MAIYDTEEEQLEQLKKWWESNQTSVIAGIIGAAVLLTGLNFWEKSRLEGRSQASQTYQELLKSSDINQTDSVEKLAEKLAAEHSSSAYTQFAALELAKVKVQNGDLEAAKRILQNQIKTADSPEIKHVARLRLLHLLLASKEYEKGLQLIAEVDPAAKEGFSASYDELQGDLYIGLDRLDEARSAYQSAIRSGHASPLAQFKLDDIAAPAFTIPPQAQ